MSEAPERVTLHVTPAGILLLARGYDTTPVEYVRADLAARRRDVRPVEAEDTEPEGNPLESHEGW